MPGSYYPAHEVCAILFGHGFQAWIVGGAVRDQLLGRPVHDWDVATNARPEQVGEMFRCAIPTGERHGTMTVLDYDVGDHVEPVEVTTFRGDGVYTDGRHPDSVRFVDTIEEDLSRRDFTINAMAFDPIQGGFADPFGGQDDLRLGIIRAVGDPEKRFAEDGLRCLRACRFAAVLRFELDEVTERAIPCCTDSFRKVSAERVRDEWLKTMAAEKPSIGYELMRRTGLLEITAPALMPLVGLEQNHWHEYTGWTHTLAVLDAVPPGDPILRVAALLHDIGKPATRGTHPKTGEPTFYNHEEAGSDLADSLLYRLKFSNADRERIVHLIRHHLVPYRKGWTKASIRRWARKVGLDHVPSVLALCRADHTGKGTARRPEVFAELDELAERLCAIQAEVPIPTSTLSLAINGHDVMAELGIGPGPMVGAILRDLLEAVTDIPALNNREDLLELVREKKGASDV